MTCVLCFNINNKNPYLFLEETSWIFQMNSPELLPRGGWSEHTTEPWGQVGSLRSGMCCWFSVSDPPVCTQFVMLGLGLCKTRFSFACWVSVRIPVGSTGDTLCPVCTLLLPAIPLYPGSAFGSDLQIWLPHSMNQPHYAFLKAVVPARQSSCLRGLSKLDIVCTQEILVLTTIYHCLRKSIKGR